MNAVSCGTVSTVRFLPNGGLLLTPEQTAALGVYLLASGYAEYEDLGLTKTQAGLCLGIAGAFSDVRDAAAVLATYGVENVSSVAAPLGL